MQSSSKSFPRQVVQFLCLTGLIYICYITSAVYHQKILKHRYENTSASDTFDLFEEPIIFTLFPQLFSTIIGYLLQRFVQQSQPANISNKKAFLCSLVVTVNMYTYNEAVRYASFPAVVMVKSCSLLSVILVGVFCSRVKDTNLKLGKSKMWIGLIVTVGVILFNYFKITEKSSNDHAISLYSGLLLTISLIGDGFFPDLQAQIKAQSKPSAIDMYVAINRSTFLIALVVAVLTFRIDYIVTFIYNHPEIRRDIIFFSLLNATGQLVIYEMIRLFKQHIPPFVIATRKCVTVIVNIIYFGHKVVFLQTVGITLVFSAIFLQVWENYQEKIAKQKEQSQKFKHLPTLNQYSSLKDEISHQNDTNEHVLAVTSPKRDNQPSIQKSKEEIQSEDQIH